MSGAFEARFGVKVHRRSLERALARKKTTRSGLTVADAAHSCEKLRAAVLRTDLTACPGLGVLRRRELAAWIREVAEKWDDPPTRNNAGIANENGAI
jgi:hypothetical protein